MKDFFYLFYFPSLLPQLSNLESGKPKDQTSFGLMGICCEGDLFTCLLNFIITAKYAN